MSDNQKNVEAASASYSSSFKMGHLALPPAKKYLVLTCMDARIDPAQAFGIGLGDAHVIRNAGGSAVDGLRSIIISEQLLGTTEIILVKHTGCGMVTFQNEDAYALVEQNLGYAEPSGPFPTPRGLRFPFGRPWLTLASSVGPTRRRS